MAERLTNDPLAWLHEDDDETPPKAELAAEQRPVESAPDSSPPPPVGVDPERVTLDSELTVAEARQLQERLLPWLEHGPEVVIDAAGVERVDAAALQVLAAFARALSDREIRLVWHSPSAPLLEAARLSGLARLLSLA